MAKQSLDYATLTPHERFALMVEAMARRDDVEADRLEDTCPRFTYRAEDAQFRDRMRRAYHIAATVCLNMRAGLGQVRIAQTFRDVHECFAAPVKQLATAAFLCGRAYGLHEGGAAPQEPENVAQVLACDPRFEESLAEIAEVANDVVLQIADTMHHAVGEAVAVDLLSQWEGFARFCRAALGVEPATVTTAFGLEPDDPVTELHKAYPSAPPAEVEAERWAKQWTRSWQRRFGEGVSGFIFTP